MAPMRWTGDVPSARVAFRLSLTSAPGQVALFTVSVLGPLVFRHAGTEIGIGSPKQRAIFAALLLTDGRALTTRKLSEALWGDDPPRTAFETVRTHVYLLRKALRTTGIDISRTPDSAYALNVDNDIVDLDRFRRCVSSAESERLSGDAQKAASHYKEGLGLWQGEPLAGVPGPFAESKRRSLDELHLATRIALLRCRMALGADHEVAAELYELTAEYPLDEGLRELLMTCLYRANRQADALTVFSDTRKLLSEQLGVDPSPRLCLTQQRILDRDESLMAAQEEISAPSTSHSAGAPTPPAEPSFQPPPPAQLPKAAAVTGRREMIDHVVDTVQEGTPALVIEGMPGVGKSTLAVHCAHLLASRFPDGQVYLDLGGPGSRGSAVSTAEALRRLLTGLGVPALAIPSETEERAALYRSLLAGRRLLLLLENACDTEQIRVLLPGSPGSAILVTSRIQAGGLVVTHGVRRVLLSEFTPAEAREFLAERLGERGRADSPRLLDRIAARCGRLPLALAVVAARASDGAGLPLEVLARSLDDAAGGLTAFRLDQDMASDLRKAFAASYEALSDVATRLFPLLAPYRDTPITPADVGLLLDVPGAAADDLLSELRGASLLTRSGHGHYRMNPLLCDYAAELSTATPKSPVPSAVCAPTGVRTDGQPLRLRRSRRPPGGREPHYERKGA
ncbi:BTAD domain-containing putative transcriptional regulator [Streptomyces sp. NPDC001822]|uniref:AfsR/SARP family transcriptional regulator n=1 Tax=Streptomyces sp. NPDC001822 TaxID=3364614 RepID=UPI00368750C8